MATEAPALGTPEGSKIEVSRPKPPPPAKEEAVVQPPLATERPVAPKKERTLKEELDRKQKIADTRVKAQIVKERKAEEKRLEKERLTKEEFDKTNRSKAPDAKATPPKIAKIDGVGIAKGVVGGSIANTKGGAGGNALTAPERSAAESYAAMLLQRLKEELDRTPGLDDGLRAEAEVHILADGRLTRARITKKSDGPEPPLPIATSPRCSCQAWPTAIFGLKSRCRTWAALRVSRSRNPKRA